MKKLLILLCLVMLLPLVIAEPLTIKTDDVTNLKLEQDYNFNIKVYNSTTGKPIVSGMSCLSQLYDDSGAYLTEQSDNTYQYTTLIKGGNFSTVGEYQLQIRCNDSTRGGYYSTIIEVTPDGYSSDREIFILAVNIIFIMFLVYGCVTLILIIYRIGKLNADATDVMLTIGGYFALLGFYWMVNYYYPSTYILNSTLLMLQVGGLTHVFLPMISLVLSMTIGALRRAENG